MIISKDSTPKQKEALRQALRQQSLHMAVRGAAPEDIQSLPEDFEPPQYSENTRQLYDVQLFPQIKSADDLIANGYATPDGQPTEQGQMAISLKKVGALNDDYTLNDTGRAMMSSREDLLQPENLNLYAKAKDLKLDDGDDLTFSQNVAELWGKAKDLSRAVYAEIDPYSGAIQAIGSIASEPLGLPKAIAGVAEQISEGLPSKEERAAATIRRQTAVDEFSEQGVQTLMGAGELMLKGVLNAPATMPFGVTPEFLDEATKDQAILAANQTKERINNEVQKVSSAEAIDDLTGFTNFVGAYQEAENLLGQEKTQEAIKEGEALGLAASIINPAAPEAIAFGVGLKAAGRVAAPFSGAMFRAEQKAAQVFNGTKTLANLQKQAADYQFVVGAAEKRAIQAEQTADKLSRAGFVDRANNARLAANRIRMQGQEAGQKFGSLQDEIARVSDDLSMLSRDATVADKVVQLTQKAKDLPFQSISGLGKVIEYTGRGMIGIDKGLSNLAAKVGVDKAYNAMNKVTTLSGLGTVASAAGLGPVAFAPAAIKAAWSTAPFIKATGEYVGMLGREAAKARGQIGFWKRVYNMPNQGFTQNMIAGLADTATLGGNLTGLGVRTGKGVLSSIPADLAFNYVAEGGNMDMGSINQALAESVFFGGTGAALGGITMGSKNRIRSLQNGDALNFYRSIADPNQRVIFNGMSGDLKRAIGTFSASYPGSQILFSNEGAGSYDRNTKMLVINPNSRNPLKPLLTHELLHHVLNNGTGDAIVANLVGDGYQTGGILRNKDGSYDAQYEQFKTEYVNDLRRQHERNVKLKDAIGDPMTKAERTFQVPDEKYLAEEYFIENNVDDMLGLVESGKLGKMAGRMIISDKMRSLGDAIINKSAVLKDLHFRLGGMMDSNGKMVVGNGFLGGQLYQSPEIRRMFKRMVNESVGRKAGVDAAKNKARNGIEIQVTGKRDPILYSLDSLWESDGDNPLQDKNGDLVPLKKETEELRSTAGLLLIDDYEKRRARGDAFEPGELAYNPENNTWSGSFLTDNQIKLLKLSGRFSNVQIKQLELLNSAATTNSDPNAAAGTRGNRFSMFYQPALKKNRKGQWRYDQIKPQLRDVVPYGVEISKDGNILIRVMSTNQLFANATEKAATKRGRLLYQGNIDAILTDANAMIDAHGKEIKPESSDRHFKEKYGSQWEEHKKFINSVFGNVGAGHKDINPLVSSDRVDAVVKSYRLDRINKSTQLVGSTKIPYQNNLIKINYLPEGEPILDANGEPKDLRYTPRYEERMPEQRQMPEGKYDRETAIKNKDVFAKRFENFKPQVGFDGLNVGWQRPSDGKFVDTNEHHNFYREDGGNQLGDPIEIGYVRIVREGKTLYYEGKPNPKQLRELKDTSIELGLTLVGDNDTTRYLPEQRQRFMPEKLDADYMKAVESGDVEAQQRLVDEAAGVIGLSQPDKRVITNPSSLWKIMETKDYGGKNSSDYMDVFETKNGGFALSMSSEFPYVEWSQSSAKGRGRTAYLELLYAAKKIGKKGVETQSFAEPEAIGVWKSLERRGLVYLKEFSREDRGDEGIYKVFKATITPKGESFVEGEITPEMRKLAQGQMRFMPEMPNAPQDTGFRSITEQGKEAIGSNYKSVAPGSILGTMRFMPEAENDRILANFPLGKDEKKKLEGKAGFAFVSDWSDSNRPYITKNGREIDVLMGGVGYTYHPEVIGKGGWAGSFSGLTNRVLNKINETDGIGLVVAGGRDSTASSRSFAIAALEEIKDDISNGTVSKSAIDNIIKNNAERLLGLKNIKSLGDYEKLVMFERGGGGLTFEQRADMIKAINSHENKKSFGISNWNDILKKYEMQNGIFVPGQIMSVVQFKKNAPLMRASDLNIKGHKSYEAVIQGKPIGMLKEKVMIGDFFKDFFTSEGTLPASYTRKVQTKMPSFKYGEGSAVLKETAKSIANAAKLK